jgi:hypothetical protein
MIETTPSIQWRVARAVLVLAAPLFILIASSGSSTEAQTPRGEWPQWGGGGADLSAKATRRFSSMAERW